MQRWLSRLTLLGLLLLSTSCAFTPSAPRGSAEIFLPPAGLERGSVTPLFLVQNSERAYNRIGCPGPRAAPNMK